MAKSVTSERYGILSFIVAFALRAVPEILLPKYPIGTDTIRYVAASLKYYQAPLSMKLSPLVIVTTLVTHSLQVSPFALYKVVTPTLYGLLALSFFSFQRSFLRWGPKECLVGSLLLISQISMLRTSWDLLNNELGLIFMFAAIAALAARNVKGRIFSSILQVLAVMANGLVGMLMIITMFSHFLASKGSTPLRGRHTIFLSVPALIAFIILFPLFPLVQVAIPQLATSPVTQIGVPDYSLLSTTDMLLLFLLCSWQVLLFAGVGVITRNSMADGMFMFLTAASIAPFVFDPGSVGSILLSATRIGELALSFLLYYYRWMFMLSVPLTIYAVQGLRELGITAKHMKGLLLIMLVFLGFSFSYASGLLPTKGLGTGAASLISSGDVAHKSVTRIGDIVPGSMVRSSIETSKLDALVSNLEWVSGINASCLLTPIAVYGWAEIFTEKNHLILFPTIAQLDEAAKLSLDLCTGPTYLVWYSSVHLDGFTQVHSNGGMAVFVLDRGAIQGSIVNRVDFRNIQAICRIIELDQPSRKQWFFIVSDI